MSIFVPELPFQPEVDKKQGYLEVQRNVEKLRKVIEQLAANPSNPWLTGDTKVSAQPSTHADPLGGTWYLADGSAIPSAETGLIAQLGTNFPDARGRAVVIKGTHVDVDAIGDNDGVTLGSRRPKHNTTPPTLTLTDPGHRHNIRVSGSGSSEQRVVASGENSPATYTEPIEYATTGITASLSGGGVGGVAALDQPAYVVVGNLFYHS